MYLYEHTWRIYSMIINYIELYCNESNNIYSDLLHIGNGAPKACHKQSRFKDRLPRSQKFLHQSKSIQKLTLVIPGIRVVLLMEEILHQLMLVLSLSHHLQSFIHPRWRSISEASTGWLYGKCSASGRKVFYRQVSVVSWNEQLSYEINL